MNTKSNLKMIPSEVATFLDNEAHGEDTLLTRDLGNHRFLDAVMDGVTKHGGKEASGSLLEALSTAKIASPEDVVAVLEQLNEEYFQTGGGKYLLSTVSTALFLEDRLHIISAGDSPIFLIRSNEMQQLSGRKGGFLAVGVARSIGAAEHLELHRVEAKVQPGDRLVLATDGVSDNLTSEELTEIVRAVSSPADAAEQVKNFIQTRITEGRIPVSLGVRFRHDDRTAIFRFFTPAK